VIAWADVKREIRSVICPQLVQVGFSNPGVTMWRHRESFVDVVSWQKKFDRFTANLGCHPRALGTGSPAEAECMFRSRVGSVLGLGDTWWSFSETVEEQRLVLEKLAPLVVRACNEWFGNFDSVGQVIQDLETPGLLGSMAGSVKVSGEFKDSLVVLASLSDVRPPGAT
jgi:hypothetical protein